MKLTKEDSKGGYVLSILIANYLYVGEDRLPREINREKDMFWFGVLGCVLFFKRFCRYDDRIESHFGTIAVLSAVLYSRAC
jgi:hypothetical protein